MVTRLHEAIPDDLNPWLRIASLIQGAGELLGLDDGMIQTNRDTGADPRGRGPGAHGLRRRPHVHGLAHPAQLLARPRQGRHSLSPERERRRDRGPQRRHVDQVRGRQHPLRRRQGRRQGRPVRALARRARTTHSSLRVLDRADDRTGPRHPRARHQHRHPGDELDHGHRVDAARTQPARSSSPASHSPLAARSVTPARRRSA